MPRLIDQNSNYRAEFGETYRSSAIFLKRNGIGLTISLMNYWKYKNDLEVRLLFTERGLDGKLVRRVPFDWSDANVINFKPEIDEGSVEIEAFASANLRIPYAAIMGIYETDSSVTMVHAYGRNHSLIEIEDRTAITEGREGCWTLEPDPQVRNVAYFHNGHMPIGPQTARLVLSRHDGTEVERDFAMDRVAPYATVAFDLDDLWPGYRQELNEETGWAAVHFQSLSGFTRLLVTRENTETGHFQATHSNFDYSSHQTNLIEATKPASMKIPAAPGVMDSKVVVYPRFTKGNYVVQYGETEEAFSTGKVIAMEGGRELAFRKSDGDLPARIVTGFRGRLTEGALPYECSLGVIHEKRPPKRYHWAVVSLEHQSRIYFTAYDEIYPVDDGKPIEMVFTLYGGDSTDRQSRTLTINSIKELPESLELTDVFPDASDLLGGSFGYVSMFCAWGGLMIFTSLTKGDSLTIEHSF